MRVISKKKLKNFWIKHPQAEIPLDNWYKVILGNDFNNLVELRLVFPSADLIGNLIAFNIAGNKYRLISAIHFNTSIVYVRDVLTHAEYDKGRWKS
jgi:mRNA interferase HigB